MLVDLTREQAAQAYGFSTVEPLLTDSHLWMLACQIRNSDPNVVIIEGNFKERAYTYVYIRRDEPRLASTEPRRVWVCQAGRNRYETYTDVGLIRYFHHLVASRDFEVTKVKAL